MKTIMFNRCLQGFCMLLLLLPYLDGRQWPDKCPSREVLAPCVCAYPNMGFLLCTNVLDPTELFNPIEATQELTMYGITILNSTLRYIPHTLFQKSDFRSIQVIDAELMSFSDGDLAFEGLESTLKEIKVRGTKHLSSLDFNQLRKLKKLEVLYVHRSHLDDIPVDFPEFPELKYFGVSYAKLSHISDTAFSKCPQLKNIGLDHNRLSTLKRSMFPDPANHLIHIDLQYNELQILPNDFFTSMPSLISVFLDNNQFTTLDELVFADKFRSFETFSMINNPIRCDCRLQWLALGAKPLRFEANCVQPAKLEGMQLKDLKVRQLPC